LPSELRVELHQKRVVHRLSQKTNRPQLNALRRSLRPRARKRRNDKSADKRDDARSSAKNTAKSAAKIMDEQACHSNP
jgi:hypothetical protein